MKVRLEKSFSLPGSADTAWALLRDIDAVAACMPGAKITERIDAQHFKGTVSVRFGPASTAFRGEVEVLSLDAAARTMQLVGKGTDTTGSSGAAMDLAARIEAIDAGSSNLLGTSEVSMSGKAAAFGGRMLDSVADQVLKQFASNFAAQVQAMQARSPPAEKPHEAADAGPLIDVATPASAAAGPSQLNAFALAWAILRDRLRSLFGAGRA
jgi:carbon monoxide dehydrogenase subunit G